jgi:hypothetical protein
MGTGEVDRILGVDVSASVGIEWIWWSWTLWLTDD